MSDQNIVPFEVALEKTGFGLYSYKLIGTIGITTISYVCILYGATIIIPANTCELQTTTVQRGMLAAAPFAGLILGSGIWGVLADMYGRRRMLLISILSAAIVNVVASISVNWIMLLCLQFLAALLGSGQYSQALSLLSESIPLIKRDRMVLIVTSISVLSQGIMSVIAIPIVSLTYSYYIPTLKIYWNSWRTLTAVYAFPSFLSAALIYSLEESPKFIYSRGREQDSLELLKIIHRKNHMGNLKKFEVTGILKEDMENRRKTCKEQILPLFKLPLLKYTIIITLLFIFLQVGSFWIWLPTIADQYIKILKSGEGTHLTLCGVLNASFSLKSHESLNNERCSLDVSAMLILLASSSLNSILIIIVSFIVNKVGRRNMIMIMTSVCGLSGVFVNLVPNVIGSGILFMIFLVGISVIGLYTATAVSLFPTYLRVFAVSFTITGGRLSSLAILQVLNYLLENNCEVGFYLFSAIYASSALLASFLDDDRKSIKNVAKENI